VTGAVLAHAAAASASITMTAPRDQVFVTDNNGHNPRPVGVGVSSFVSPNGNLVALRGVLPHCDLAPLTIANLTTGKSVTARGFYNGCMPTHPVWSRDSKTLYTFRYADMFANHPRLVAINGLTGSVKVVPVRVGAFPDDWVDLSPDGTRLVIAADTNATSSLARRNALRVFNLHSRKTTTLKVGKFIAPIWGATRIAFAVLRSGTVNGTVTGTTNIAIIGQTGRGYRVLTHARRGHTIRPVAFSANGRRLLGSNDYTGSLAINPLTGAVRSISRTVAAQVLTRDGRFLLGYTSTGGNGPGNVWRIAWVRGGPKTLIAAHAIYPSLSQ
jgi:hypothetical protein